MEGSDSVLGYVLSGLVFYIFGLKWCYEYAKYWLNENSHLDGAEIEMTKLLRFSRNCQRIFRTHPFEGTLKLVATAFGLASTMTGSFLNVATTQIQQDQVSPKDVHATIYLFFALSGLVDVLNFYFPNVVGEGLTKMALAQAFFVEGFLFLRGSPANDHQASSILASIVWTTSLAIVFELIWPEVKLLRGASTLLHATWLAHMVRSQKIQFDVTGKMALTFSWHFAAAFVVTLTIVSVTRSCAPKLRHNEPPEIPIYDYCHDLPDHRA